jgi:hypothetical protein
VISYGQVDFGLGNGEPRGLEVGVFIRWKVVYCLQYCVTNLRMRGHQNILETFSRRVRSAAGCPVELLYSCRMSLSRVLSLGKQILSAIPRRLFVGSKLTPLGRVLLQYVGSSA